MDNKNKRKKRLEKKGKTTKAKLPWALRQQAQQDSFFSQGEFWDGRDSTSGNIASASGGGHVADEVMHEVTQTTKTGVVIQATVIQEASPSASQPTNTIIEEEVMIDDADFECPDADSIEIVSTKQQNKNIVDVIFEELDGSFTVKSELHFNFCMSYCLLISYSFFLVFLIISH